MMAATEEQLSPTAASLVEIVRGNPGIHFRGLAREADISSMGQLRHHVDRLRHNGKILEVEDGRYKRFFVAGSHPPEVRRTLARFSRPVPRRIGKLLLWRPMSRAELRRTLGCADSTLGYHLARMSLHGDLVKTGMSNRCRYSLADPETVRAALQMQEDGNGQEQTAARGHVDHPLSRPAQDAPYERADPRPLPATPPAFAARAAIWQRHRIHQEERKIAHSE